MAISLRSFETRENEDGEHQFKNPAGEWVTCTAEVRSALDGAWELCDAAGSGQGSGHRLVERAKVLRECGFDDEAGFFERKADSLFAKEPKPY
jgi:hypothetical protein